MALETLHVASREVQRLTTLLKEYRSFARPQKLNLEQTDLGEILKEAVAPHRRSYEAAGVQVQVQIEEDLPGPRRQGKGEADHFESLQERG